MDHLFTAAFWLCANPNCLQKTNRNPFVKADFVERTVDNQNLQRCSHKSSSTSHTYYKLNHNSKPVGWSAKLSSRTAEQPQENLEVDFVTCASRESSSSITSFPTESMCSVLSRQKHFEWIRICGPECGLMSKIPFSHAMTLIGAPKKLQVVIVFDWLTNSSSKSTSKSLFSVHHWGMPLFPHHVQRKTSYFLLNPIPEEVEWRYFPHSQKLRRKETITIKTLKNPGQGSGNVYHLSFVDGPQNAI